MADGRGRSDAEREAARLERERRRAQRSGRIPAGDSGSHAEDPPPVVPPAAADAEPVVRRGPVEPDADPVVRRGGVEPDAERPEHPFGFDDGWEPADEDQYQEDWEDGDRPAGTRRVTALQRMADAPQRERTRVARPKRPRARGGSWRRRVGSLLALALAAVLIWFLVELFQPLHDAGHGRIRVVIPAHSSSSQIGDELERDGVIASSFFFKLRATLAGDRGDLRAGAYTLQHDMSYSRVLDVLTTAPKAAPTSQLTLIPGRTRLQIDRLLRAQGIRGSYIAASRHSRLLNPRAYGAPRSTPDLEGFLFPDSYQLRDPITASSLVADQLRNFRRQFATVPLGYARRRHLTPYDVLIIASMVEDESATARDRPLVASVIYNRLARGMPLQIDATTRYATGNYTRPLTQSQLNSSSPYNTRIHPGLTPTPIDNPGLAAIQAAAHPARTDYLYFVVKPCGNGEQTFTGSYQQFLADSARYQQARSRRGGRSPEHC
jgi:uncharacterized YceG family protein